MEETLDKIYPSQEFFYYSLFNNIKILAENNISYRDSHVGNIMPNYSTEKDLQLIDFDGAKIVQDTKTAAIEAMGSAYNRILFNNFKKLPGLSNRSAELIRWFENQ